MKSRTIGYILIAPMVMILGIGMIVAFNWFFLMIFILFLIGLVLTGKKEYRE